MIIKECFDTEVTGEFDVVVCGGGFAGISASLAAARQGKKVALIEKQYILGGLGTAGIVTIYLPLCDGLGHQVSFGIAEELLKLSVSMGAEDKYPDNWLAEGGSRTIKDKRFEVQYNPQIFALLAEKLLQNAGVHILYGSYATGVVKNKDKIEYVIIESKSGREAYAAKTFVDATGDCDIAKFSGAPTDTFKQGNVLASWYYSLGKDGYKLNTLGCSDIPDEEKTEENSTELLVNKRFSGLTGEDLSKLTCLSHQSLLQDLNEHRKGDGSIVPVTIATIPQIRMTRKIIGEYVLSDKEMHTYFEDSIGMVSDWKKRGPVYEVPFRTLYSKKVKNLVCAGRCTSVTETMWDIMRVIPCCAVTGQAAGTAAAMTDDFAALEIKKLQTALEANNVIIHEKEIM